MRTSFPRRRLLATTGTISALAIGAGCLDDSDSESDPDSEEPADSETESDDTTNGTDDSTSSVSAATDLRTQFQWLPAAVDADKDVTIHYADLTAIRDHESELSDDLRESTQLELADLDIGNIDQFGDATAIDASLSFGSSSNAANVAFGGSFEPDAADAEPTETVGEFNLFEHENGTLAVSEEWLLASDPDGLGVETLLEAGREETELLVETDETTATLAGELESTTIAVGRVTGADAATGELAAVGHGATLDSETSTVTFVGVTADGDDPDSLREELERSGGGLEDFTVETTESTAVGEGTVPTDEVQLPSLGQSVEQEVQAGVSIDVDHGEQMAEVFFTSSGTAEYVEVEDDLNQSKRLDEVGDRVTLTYDEGDETTIRVIAVAGDRKTVVMTEDISPS
ncbi:uncharacterized protein Nmag_3486 [Natrialba magadii ATCC 43099]|uniref:Uncharacterized protein n=1 Tax=Natrialba magadii (strain ATCC 43099 / DSM 3394 / CCM 3739 / CIP 104546 / IAM 13178 / JCM 8861 / NBRC 102185 / NCIMB 2190 / MS3) TaxID=547559 RepID=D3STG9_NATMM|nr:hypothetical protein [Natrialba magadii]ADD07036.1 uncharacterized protein Nmag_3486 [Natrialba magadii ATCC 43099]ELY28821.1 hypothetical protein C500_12785 [Natrialba magadii ATCC 43099]